MARHVLLAVAAAFALAACSGAPAVDEPPTEILCAAETLYLAREPARSLAGEDYLRARVSVFTSKLDPARQQRWWSKIDGLADRRGATPLVPASACEALLTAEDRRSLAATAAQEANSHQPMPEVRP